MALVHVKFAYKPPGDTDVEESLRTEIKHNVLFRMHGAVLSYLIKLSFLLPSQDFHSVYPILQSR